MSRLTTSPPPSVRLRGEAVVSVAEDDILSLKLSGYLSEEIARQLLVRTREVLKGRRVRCGFSDALDVSGMAVAIQGPGREFVALAKAHGVREAFCAATSPAMRLLGVGLALATGGRIHFYPTVEEAWAHARAAVQRRS